MPLAVFLRSMTASSTMSASLSPTTSTASPLSKERLNNGLSSSFEAYRKMIPLPTSQSWHLNALVDTARATRGKGRGHDARAEEEDPSWPSSGEDEVLVMRLQTQKILRRWQSLR